LDVLRESIRDAILVNDELEVIAGDGRMLAARRLGINGRR
jgi:hypothetical protein